jgi:hypothetical protein
LGAAFGTGTVCPTGTFCAKDRVVTASTDAAIKSANIA